MSDPIKNPAFLLPLLLGAGAIAATLGGGYYYGRRDGQGIKEEEARLRRAINEGPGGGLPGGFLTIKDPPIFPPPSAP